MTHPMIAPGCDDPSLAALASAVGAALLARGWRLACAESCTGGWVAKLLTDIPGSSAWFDRGYVAYCNQAKQDMLGVRPGTLAAHGAVSAAAVAEMAEGARARGGAQVALAISGIAGPGGGSAEKPVGTVCFAWSLGAAPPLTRRRLLAGDREAVRRQAVQVALGELLARLAEV